jgi:hypothetical protein
MGAPERAPQVICITSPQPVVIVRVLLNDCLNCANES